jgi:hypothetical protein
MSQSVDVDLTLNILKYTQAVIIQQVKLTTFFNSYVDPKHVLPEADDVPAAFYLPITSAIHS